MAGGIRRVDHTGLLNLSGCSFTSVCGQIDVKPAVGLQAAAPGIIIRDILDLY